MQTSSCFLNDQCAGPRTLTIQTHPGNQHTSSTFRWQQNEFADLSVAAVLNLTNALGWFGHADPAQTDHRYVMHAYTGINWGSHIEWHENFTLLDREVKHLRQIYDRFR